MNKPIIQSLAILFFIFLSIDLYAQDLGIEIKSEKIIVEKDLSFQRQVSVILKASNEYRFYKIFYDSELEKVSNIQIFHKKGKRFKLSKYNSIKEEAVELDYITSKKIKTVFIPAEIKSKITYTISCHELMYFSDLRFFSYHDIDTLKYDIKIPKAFRFIHNTIYKDSLDFMAMDSLQSDSLTTWKIKVKPIKTKPDPLIRFGIYKNMKEPLMRTLILPKNDSTTGKTYMNNWYLKQVTKRRGLNHSVTTKIDALTEGLTDSKDIMNVLYTYVQDNFKYVAIEIGMGAFIPSHANEVFTNKQGDCKDLSNFLSEALNYKGIKSDVALAATFHHISDCDFPSLSSANHVICIAYIDGETLLLDPTDPIHISETPVQSLQKRSIFIINSEGGKFYKVPSFSPEENLIQYHIDLKTHSKTMSLQGPFSTLYKGLSANFLRRKSQYINKEEIQTLAKTHFESVYGNHEISNLKVDFNPAEMTSKGHLKINGKIFEDDTNCFLYIDFLPRLFEAEERETLLNGTHLGSPFNKKTSLNIKIDQAFEPFTPITHSYTENHVSFILKISNPSESMITCEYEFQIDHIFIDKKNITITNEILSSFKKIINEPIILKKKSS